MSRGIRVEDHGRWFRNRRRFKRSACSESCSQLHKGVLIVSITITRTAMAFCCEKKEIQLRKDRRKNNYISGGQLFLRDAFFEVCNARTLLGMIYRSVIRVLENANFVLCDPC